MIQDSGPFLYRKRLHGKHFAISFTKFLEGLLCRTSLNRYPWEVLMYSFFRTLSKHIYLFSVFNEFFQRTLKKFLHSNNCELLLQMTL